jgi:hypothetical protein
LGDVTQRPGGYPREPSRATTSCIRTLAAALNRTGTACEFEVPLGVGNSLALEVTYRCNMEDQNCPHAGSECTVIIPGIPYPTNLLYEEVI